jgi:pyruvate dehydrogenase E2 component (dihydrolipoamide acetyltransferase)
MATEKVTIPDFGDVQEITVVEVYVAVGDEVAVEDALVALESEKAVMDIPSTAAGKVQEVYIKENDSVSSGDAIVLLELAEEEDGQVQEEETGKEPEQEEKSDAPAKQVEPPEESKDDAAEDAEEAKEEQEEQKEQAPGSSHAAPSVRGYAREVGVDLAGIKGSGPKGRILKEDVEQQRGEKGGQEKAPATSAAKEQQPLEDFSKYGEIEEKDLGRIKKVAGPHLQRSWNAIPHVTHFDEADVTQLEKFRKALNAEAGKDEPRFSPLVGIIKALVATLHHYPTFNASLDEMNNSLILKHFYNIGVAVDTPNGLVVPVIKNAQTKGMRRIATELGNLSQSARDGKLAIGDMQGASFTISSLGGIGGTGFTPIVSAPQVAILGLSKNYLKPVWDEEAQVFAPRLTLPFSLSYDHRVIDGAEAARFCRTLSANVEDIKRALL